MSKKQLLFSVTKEDLEIQTFRSGGKGGREIDMESIPVSVFEPTPAQKAAIRRHTWQFVIGLAVICGTMLGLDGSMSVWYAVGVAVGGYRMLEGVVGLILEGAL